MVVSSLVVGVLVLSGITAIACCIVSSRCSREEEKMNEEMKALRK